MSRNRQVCSVMSLVVAMAACSGAGSGTVDVNFSVDGMVDELASVGIAAVFVATVEDGVFPVPANRYDIGAGTLSVYVYDGAGAARRQAEDIAPDGGTIGGSQPTSVSWVAPPHFFRRDNLIVLYLGDSAELVERLSRLFGAPFAER